MPLKKGTSRKTMSKNIESEMHSYEKTGKIGNSKPASKKKAQKQAIAIAYSKARESGAKLPKKKLDALLGDKEALKKLVSHHIVNAKITKAEVDAGKVATLDGKEVKLSVADGVKVDNVPVAGEGLHADNGVVHPLSAVLASK